ncbi:MAG: acyl carrier protein [Clostridiales bacterium]|nr:acyl carrier protein [Clostridiales bacterium]
MEEIEKKIIELIEEIQPYEEFDKETNLLEGGILDSVALFLLVQEIEETYNIVIDLDEIAKENFENVMNIVNFVKDKVDNK